MGYKKRLRDTEVGCRFPITLAYANDITLAPCQCIAINVFTTHTVIVFKSVTKTTVIMVNRIQLRIFETANTSYIGNEEWDDYRISKVQCRSQL